MAYSSAPVFAVGWERMILCLIIFCVHTDAVSLEILLDCIFLTPLAQEAHPKGLNVFTA